MPDVEHSVEPSAEAIMPIDRLRREGIRAMSWGDTMRMEKAGFNLVLPWQQILEDATKPSKWDDDVPIRLAPRDGST